MKTINKKSTTKFLAALIAVLLFAAYFSFVQAPTGARADETAAVEFMSTAVDITNGNFTESESNYPATATGWTGSYLDKSTGGVTGGVIDISREAMTAANNADTLLKDTYLLKNEVYEEYLHDTPKPNREAGIKGEGKVLLINSPYSEVAYAYKSNTISLSKNSYYVISVWAKTSVGASAYIKLAKPDDGGLKNEIAFRNVNTFDYHGYDYSSVNNNEDKEFGWVEYSFYIETSTLSDTSVILSLQLGDYSEWKDSDRNPVSSMPLSKGYVMFDNVTIYQYSADNFDSMVSGFNKTSGKKNTIASDDYRYFYTKNNPINGVATELFYSECDAADLSIKDGKLLGLESDPDKISPDYAKYVIGSFDEVIAVNEWTPADDSAGSLMLGPRSSIETPLGIRKNSEIPFAPDGKGNSIGLMSSYSAGYFEPECRGVKTPEFSLTRHKFYRLSVWVKSINEDAANVVIRGQNYKGLSVDEQKNQLYYSSGLKGLSGGVESRNGWTEVSFFFEGSSFADYSVHVELWLGIGAGLDNDGKKIEEQKVKGVAMFDNLRIEELTSTEFTNYSGSGTTVTFDSGSDSSGGFANSSFDKVADYTVYEYPFAPKNWTYYEVSENTVGGMSKNRVVEYDSSYVDQDNWDDLVVRGIFPTDEEHFNANQTIDGKAKYGALNFNPGSADNVKNTNGNGNNALLISSDTDVAVGYSSSTVSVAANLSYTVEVDMLTFDMSGYGANLVLKKGENIVSTIEKIGLGGIDTDYHTYSFYVQGGDSDIGDLSVEIWLGLYDRDRNISKLGAGTIVIDDVKLIENSEGVDAYTEYYAKFLRGEDNGTFGFYSFKGDNFSAFDRYTDAFIKPSYDYNVTGSHTSFGVFDSTNLINGNGYLWEGYKNENAAGYKHMLYLSNDTATYSRVSTNFRRTVSGVSYYKLTFKIKVNLPVQSENVQYQGAYVGIRSGETDHLISDIKNTALIYDVSNPTSGNSEYFRDYTVYIKGSTEEDSSDDINIVFGIGGENENQNSLGQLVVASISYNISSDTEYVEAKELIETAGSRESRTSLFVSFADEKEEDKEDNGTSSSTSKLTAGQSWLVVSGIILAVGIIFAVVSFSVRYLARKRRVTAKSTGAAYDRKSTLVIQHNKRATGDSVSFDTDSYEAYDEDAEYEYLKEQAARSAVDTSEIDSFAEAPDAEFDEADDTDSKTDTKETADVETAEPIEAEVESAGEAADVVSPAAEETAEAEEINYDEVVEFKAPEFVPEKREETLQEAIEKAKAKPEEDDKPADDKTWDSFDD